MKINQFAIISSNFIAFGSNIFMDTENIRCILNLQFQFRSYIKNLPGSNYLQLLTRIGKWQIIFIGGEIKRVDIKNPLDSPSSANPERDRCPIDFVFCNICSTAIYVEDLQDEDIICVDGKAEVEYLRSILLDNKKHFNLNYFLLSFIWGCMFL